MELERMLALDVSSYVEKKNGLSYLSWANAWREFIKVYPTARYEILKDNDKNCHFGNSQIGYMVYTTVTVDEITHEMWLPVMDFKNKSMLAPTTFDINKAVMRCLTKNLAMFGLGLYIYAGEDIPEDDKPKPEYKVDTQADMPASEKVDTKQIISEVQAQALLQLALDTKSSVSDLCKYYEVKDLNELNMEQFMGATKILVKRQAK